MGSTFSQILLDSRSRRCVHCDIWFFSCLRGKEYFKSKLKRQFVKTLTRLLCICIYAYVIYQHIQHTCMLALQFFWILPGWRGVLSQHLGSRQVPHMQCVCVCACMHTHKHEHSNSNTKKGTHTTWSWSYTHFSPPAQTDPSRYSKHQALINRKLPLPTPFCIYVQWC